MQWDGTENGFGSYGRAPAGQNPNDIPVPIRSIGYAGDKSMEMEVEEGRDRLDCQGDDYGLGR